MPKGATELKVLGARAVVDTELTSRLLELVIVGLIVDVNVVKTFVGGFGDGCSFFEVLIKEPIPKRKKKKTIKQISRIHVIRLTERILRRRIIF